MALLGPQLTPIPASGPGLIQSIRQVVTCDAGAIGQVAADPQHANPDPGCATNMVRTLERSPTAQLVRDVR